MDKALILLLAMATPAPYRPLTSPPRRSHAVQYEKSPIWGKDPVRVARFGSNIEQQLAAQKFGADRNKALMEQLGKGRIPIVGAVQLQTQFSRSFSTSVR